ncbi:MAG: addiction module toxin RelE [Planctomycetes bacterium]|nr:addiction module toxin RelE [Planctomycetota bacterium]
MLTFLETRWFTRDWERLGLNDEEDLASLQFAIMNDPVAAPVIRGTGGLRKLRFSPPGWKVGKSGALRICYVYYEPFGVVLLVVVYTKSTKDTLSGEERSLFKQLIAEQRRLLAERYFT